MNLNTGKKRLFFAKLCLFVFLATYFFSLKLFACPIPVYQYALEHWQAELYILEVFVPEKTSKETEQAWKEIQEAEKKLTANFKIKKLETAPKEANNKAWMKLFYPERSRRRDTIWQAELNAENVKKLLFSPVRTELAKSLADRTSVVWLLVLSGNRKEDKKLQKHIDENLQHFLATVVIPEESDWGGETIYLDHEVNFKLLTLRKDDPKEELLVKMLYRSEADLESDFADTALLFPVFGRGIMLYALVAEGINRWTLEKAIDFLTGSCSCQVKAANPGLDLLLSLPWNELVIPSTPASVGGTVGAETFIEAIEKQKEQN